MKKLIYTLLLLPVLLAACVQNVDDVYDKPVSLRVEEAVQEYQTLLQSSENGWLMEYYPSSSQAYGGFLFTMKFEAGDKVTVSCNAFGKPADTAESLYSIKKDMGPTLNFDSYNEIFHYFSDPDLDEGGGHGKGYEGDYEFLLRSHSENEIILRGKKTKNFIRMTRLTESSQSFLEKIIAMEEKMDDVPPGTLGFKGEVDGKELILEMESPRRFKITYDGAVVSTVGACSMLYGMKFYTAVEVAGRKLQNFTFDNQTYTCMDEGATDVSVRAFKDPGYLEYNQFIGSYTMAYDNATRDVTIEELEKNATLLVKGFSPNFNVVLKYDPKSGKAYILSQKVATVNARDIWICAWDSNKGNLTWGTAIGMVTEWNMSTDNFVLTFKDFGSWAGFVVNGIYYYAFDAGTMTNGGFFNGWGSNSFCSNLKTLTKK